MYQCITITYLYYSFALNIHVDIHQEDIHPAYDHMVDLNNYMLRHIYFQIFIIHTLQIKNSYHFEKCGYVVMLGGSHLDRMCNNTPSNAIVNAIYIISYMSLLETTIQTAYTGRSYRPRSFQFSFLNELNNFTNVVIAITNKSVFATLLYYKS